MTTEETSRLVLERGSLDVMIRFLQQEGRDLQNVAIGAFGDSLLCLFVLRVVREQLE